MSKEGLFRFRRKNIIFSQWVVSGITAQPHLGQGGLSCNMTQPMAKNRVILSGKNRPVLNTQCLHGACMAVHKGQTSLL